MYQNRDWRELGKLLHLRFVLVRPITMQMAQAKLGVHSRSSIRMIVRSVRKRMVGVEKIGWRVVGLSAVVGGVVRRTHVDEVMGEAVGDGREVLLEVFCPSTTMAGH